MAYPPQGVGDMLKSTYDPDKDGLIALAQLVAAVCSETEAAAIAILDCVVGHFQYTPGTGTWAGPASINDGTTVAKTTADTVNKYIIVLFPYRVRISQYRIFEDDDGNIAGDGEITIQYRDPHTGVWTNWKTGIVIGRAGAWKPWDTTPSAVEADAIKIIATKIDTGLVAQIYIREIEVKY